MRSIASILFLGAAFMVAEARAVDVGALVHTTRRTLVFKLPTARSKILADIDPGVLLVVLRVSPRGTWLLLEDEDGNSGWVPTNRTDFAQLNAPPPAPILPEALTAQAPPPPEEVNTAHRVRHELGAVGRWVSRMDPNGNRDVGALYSLLLPQKGSTSRWFGLQTGWLAAFGGEGYAGWSLPWRVRSIGLLEKSSIGLGPDFGMTYHHRNSGGPSLWSLNLGYSVGWYGQGLFANVRGGVDFKHSTRISIELTTGFAF